METCGKCLKELKLLKTWNNELFLGIGGPKHHPNWKNIGMMMESYGRWQPIRLGTMETNVEMVYANLGKDPHGCRITDEHLLSTSFNQPR